MTPSARGSITRWRREIVGSESSTSLPGPEPTVIASSAIAIDSPRSGPLTMSRRPRPDWRTIEPPWSRMRVAFFSIIPMAMAIMAWRRRRGARRVGRLERREVAARDDVRELGAARHRPEQHDEDERPGRARAAHRERLRVGREVDRLGRLQVQRRAPSCCAVGGELRRRHGRPVVPRGERHATVRDPCVSIARQRRRRHELVGRRRRRRRHVRIERRVGERARRRHGRRRRRRERRTARREDGHAAARRGTAGGGGGGSAMGRGRAGPPQARSRTSPAPARSEAVEYRAARRRWARRAIEAAAAGPRLRATVGASSSSSWIGMKGLARALAGAPWRRGPLRGDRGRAAWG